MQSASDAQTQRDRKIVTALKITANELPEGKHRTSAFDALHLIGRLYDATQAPAPAGIDDAAVERADARRYRYLLEHHSYYYGQDIVDPSPAECGIQWNWQQSRPNEPNDFDALIDADIARLDEEDRAALSAAATVPSTPPQAGGVPAARDVLAERRRQVEVEGWTPEHDDAHDPADLSRAALSYVSAASLTAALGFESHKSMPPLHDHVSIAFDWPWELSAWKPGSVRRMLVKAGALILAEIERLDRAATRPSTEAGR